MLNREIRWNSGAVPPLYLGVFSFMSLEKIREGRKCDDFSQETCLLSDTVLCVTHSKPTVDGQVV